MTRPIVHGQHVKFYTTEEQGFLEGKVVGVFLLGSSSALAGSSWALIEIDVGPRRWLVYSADVAESEGKYLEILARQL